MTELEQLAAQIVQELDERNDGMVRKVLHTIGIERGRAHFEETKRVLANGGMRTNDGLRDRTSGGIFFHLVRLSISETEPRALFQNAKWPPAQLLPRLPWPDALRFAQGLEPHEKGELDEMHIKVIGRPRKTVKTESCMLLVMVGRPLPKLPRGLPQPPNVPQTVVCMVSFRHWEKVASELGASCNQLRIGGYPVFQPQQNMTILLAESVDIVEQKEAKRDKAA